MYKRQDEGVIYEEGPPNQIFENPSREKTRAFIQRIKTFPVSYTHLDVYKRQDSDITDMLLAPQRWQATAAVNARVIGEVNMRILAQKLKGEQTPESFDLPASLIEATLLNGASRVSNLGLTVESFGTSNAFLQDWMVRCV